MKQHLRQTKEQSDKLRDRDRKIQELQAELHRRDESHKQHDSVPDDPKSTSISENDLVKVAESGSAQTLQQTLAAGNLHKITMETLFTEMENRNKEQHNTFTATIDELLASLGQQQGSRGKPLPCLMSASQPALETPPQPEIEVAEEPVSSTKVDSKRHCQM